MILDHVRSRLPRFFFFFIRCGSFDCSCTPSGYLVTSTHVSHMSPVTAPIVFDKPNGHGILEIVDRALPALVNLVFVATGEYERAHITSKLKRKGCHDTQKLALSEDAVRRGLQLATHGYQWGGQAKLTIGPGVTSILGDPRGLGSRTAPLLTLETKRQSHLSLVGQLPPRRSGGGSHPRLSPVPSTLPLPVTPPLWCVGFVRIPHIGNLLTSSWRSRGVRCA